MNKCYFLFLSILISGMISLSAQISSNEIFRPERVQTLKSEIVDFFKVHLEKETGRKNITLDINANIQKDKISFTLPKLYTRDMLFSLTILKTDTGYRVEGRMICETERTSVQALVGKWLGQGDVAWGLDIGALGLGIVSVPCADVYVDPVKERGDNLATQILYGTSVILLETTQDKKFFHIVGTEDHYLGWIASESFAIVTEERWQSWVHIPKVYLASFIDKPIMLYPGSSLGLIENKPYVWNSDKGQEPISIETKEYIPLSTKATSEQIVKTAKRFLPQSDLGGISYLWGGTCVPQLDCSGFVQTVFRLNNILLPRDADQQYQFSTPVELKDMQPGDMIFFSKNSKHPSHVGIYLGNDLYIHCSPAVESGVKVNNLNGETEYEKSLKSIYFAGGTVLK